MKRLFAIFLLLPLAAAAEFVVPIDAVESSVNVRTAPDAKSDVVGKLNRGEYLVLVASVPGWHEVEIPGAATGYISADWTRVEEAPVGQLAAVIAPPAAAEDVAAEPETVAGEVPAEPEPAAGEVAAEPAEDKAAARLEPLVGEVTAAPKPVLEPAAAEPEAVVEQDAAEPEAVAEQVVAEPEAVVEHDAAEPEPVAMEVPVEPEPVAVPVEAVPELAPAAEPATAAPQPPALAEQGLQGPQGPPGPPGPPGPAGTGNVEGSVDFLVKFTAPTIGGNSQIFDDGNFVGIGTTEPEQRLEVNGNIRINEQNSSVAGLLITQSGGETGYIMHNRASTLTIGAGSIDRITIDRDGNVGFGVARPKSPVELANGAHVTPGGVWTNSSSRARKENIHTLTAEDALAALDGLEPVQFNYRNDQSENYVGFIAEDVPDLVAMQDRDGLSAMDIVAVLTKVVQEQQKRIAALEARLERR